MSEFEHARVGVGVWIRKSGKILLGKRRGQLAPGNFAPPGGKLEKFESWEACARREVKEETGLRIKNIRYVTATNDFYKPIGFHFVTLHVVADWAGGEPQELEPDKNTDWNWYEWKRLPRPLLMAARNFVKSGYNPTTI